MGDTLKYAAEWLEDQRCKFAVSEIAYIRETTTIRVKSSIGKSSYFESDNNGFALRVESRDYLIRSEELKIDGKMIYPKAGDLIVETHDDGSTSEYEVAPFGADGCFRKSDPYGITLRIHTKLLGENIT